MERTNQNPINKMPKTGTKTPEYMKKASKTYYDKMKSNPEFMAKRRLSCKAYRDKIKQKIVQNDIDGIAALCYNISLN